MSALAEKLKLKYFGGDEHPYQTFEREVVRLLRPDDTLLDAGCGRTAPVLQKYRGRAGKLIGLDLVDFPAPIEGIELINGDLSHIDVGAGTVDLVMSRSVIEHVENPRAVYSEMYRVLKPGGRFVFLTANLWDYASLIASLVPNSWHPWVVSKTEGRAEEDVFPIQYRSNTHSAVRKWAGETGFEIEKFEYLGQYPCYFMFNGALFFLATGYQKLIARVKPLNFLQGWIFVVVRKPL
jgi:ubiquinone/menaquinone biosynthesis C-methylase UbiE